MNIQAWNALLVIALLIVLAGGGYILNENFKQKQVEAEQEAAAEREQRAAEVAAKKQEFEDFLNAFLKDIHGKMREYQMARKIVDELDNPANLTKKEYAVENAVLAEQTIMDLELQMGEVMLSFEEADKEFEDLMAKYEEDEQDGIREKWESVHGENAEKYTQFFTMDQDILRAQLKLLQYYAEHNEEMFINLNSNRIIFEADESEAMEKELKDNIRELKALRQEILSQEEEK